MSLRIGALLCLLFVLVAPAYAQSIQFQWEAHPEAAQLLGFKLYQTKTAGTYTTTPVATFAGGTTTTGTLPKPGLGNYCWVLTAYVTDVESDRSNEACTVLKPQPPRLTRAVLALINLPGRGLSAIAQVFIVKRPGLRITS